MFRWQLFKGIIIDNLKNLSCDSVVHIHVSVWVWVCVGAHACTCMLKLQVLWRYLDFARVLGTRAQVLLLHSMHLANRAMFPLPFTCLCFLCLKRELFWKWKMLKAFPRRRNHKPNSTLCFCFFRMLSPSVHQTFWAAITPSVLTILTNSVIVDSYPNLNCCAHVFQGSHVSLAFPL